MSQGFPPPYEDPNNDPNPFASPLQSEIPATRPTPVQGPNSTYRPHMGGLTLTLGILGLCVALMGWVTCPVISMFGLGLSVPAWLLARRDIKLIDAGEMDPTGRGIETAALVIGIIGTILCGLSLLLVFGAIAFIGIAVMSGA